MVADVNCAVCNTLLGWKYVDARENAQKYKIGKFILETKRVLGVRCWEDGDVRAYGDSNVSPRTDLTSNSTPDLSSNSKNRKNKLAYAGGRGSGSGSAMGGMGMEAQTKEHEEESGLVFFDSEDEEECEELFAGIWDAEVVRRRRTRREDRRKRDVEKERERVRAGSKDSGVGGL